MSSLNLLISFVNQKIKLMFDCVGYYVIIEYVDRQGVGVWEPCIYIYIIIKL